MLLAEEIRGLVKTVLSQDDLLLFERALESVPEVYNYSGVMTDEQLNHLIAFLSRSKENIFFELKHAKEEHAKAIAEKDRCLAEKDEALAEKDEALRKNDEAMKQQDKAMKDMGAELTRKDRVIRSKDKRISDLEERLAEANEVRYGRRGNKSKQSTKDDESGNSGKGSANGNKDNPGGADRQQGEDECDGKTPQDPVTEDKSGDGKNSASIERKFNPENRPECYRTMRLNGGMGLKEIIERLNKTEHKFDRSQLPAGAIIKDSRLKTFYTLKTFMLKETVEQLRVQLPGEKKARWMYIPMPGEENRRPIKGTKASPELLQALAYECYVKRVTSGNLLVYLKDMGLQVSKNTLKNWLKKGKRYLDNLIKVLKDKALEKDSILNCDETWCKVRRYNKYLKKYMWVLVNKTEKIVIFFYDEGSRGRKVLTDFLGESEVKAIMTDGYNAYNFLDGTLSVDHLLCMAHAFVKFKKAYNLGKDTTAQKFIKLIQRLYDLESVYKEKGYTAQQIYEARQSEETSRIEQELRSLLKEELSKENPKRSYYMDQALNYFDHFKEGLFMYRRDGRYPIDNNLAERQVRPFTALRKAIQHYGSDAGAEMAAVYLSVVSTVKLAGQSVWRFLGDFFEDIVTGGKKHLKLLSLSTT
mgnify:CR=1 FL=1